MSTDEILTAEQDATLEAVGDEFIGILSNLQKEPDIDDVNGWLSVAYGLFGIKSVPAIVIADSPAQAVLMARSAILGSGGTEAPENTDCCGLYDAWWVATYISIKRAGIDDLGEFAPPIEALHKFMMNAWDTILMDELAIVIRHPVALRTDRDGQLHGNRAPAIEWKDGEEFYFHHGVSIDKRMACDPKSFSREEYLGISNTEQRRALSEIAGWDWVAEILGTIVISTWNDHSTGLSYELLSNSDARLSFLKKQSPILQNGEQPIYVEPVHEDLTSAEAARKWQATNLSPAECNCDPRLSYGSET